MAAIIQCFPAEGVYVYSKCGGIGRLIDYLWVVMNIGAYFGFAPQRCLQYGTGKEPLKEPLTAHHKHSNVNGRG